MSELLDGLRLFGGFVYLILGGDLLVRGALALSQKLSISTMIVGLTVVAFGTSAPELVLSVYATATGFTGVALGNVVGSNIANVFLVLGIPALISPIVADAPELRKQTVLMVMVSAVFVFMLVSGVLSRLEGLILVCGFVATLVYVCRNGVMLPGAETLDEAQQFERVLGIPSHVPGAIAFLLLGLVLLPLGANLTVEGAEAIARKMDIPDIIIGSTIVAVGTSLPELTTTVIAAYHKSSEIAVGNVIGSNIFNILLVAGTSALVAPLPAPAPFIGFDIWVMLLASLVMLGFIALRRPIGRTAGFVFVAAYIGYLLYLV